jgi:hypothetical protein
MEPEVKEALKEALTVCVSKTEPMVRKSKRPFLVWKRVGGGSWHGSSVLRPYLSDLYLFDWTALSADFDSLFIKHYPTYIESVGVQGLRVRLDPGSILHKAVFELWKRHWPATPMGNDVEVLLSEFEQFMDSQVFDVDYIAPLEAFHAEEGVDEIPLPDGVTITRLTETEVTELFGGWSLQVGPVFEFAFKGRAELEKRLGPMPVNELPAHLRLQEKLERTQMALRCFKSGGLSYVNLRLSPRRFVPIRFPNLSANVTPVAGTYRISSGEVTALQRHVGWFANSLHMGLELAAERLAEAEGRTRYRDRLLDAAIGLEAVLLFNCGSEMYRGELRYRFALNFATLADSPEHRYSEFKSAQSVYDTRSAIAHGARVDEQEVSERAKQACQMLRKVIQRFLPEGANPSYVRDAYWTKALLNG